MKIKWLNRAKRKLSAEVDFIALEDPALAIEIYAYIKERVGKLRQFPESSRIGRVFGTRELVIEKYPYIVPYRIKNNKIEILSIMHTSRKPPTVW